MSQVKGSSNAVASQKEWLIAYNSISASLWSIVLFNTVFLGLTVGQPYLFIKTNMITTIIQSLAVVEIYNSAMGYVKSPLATTVMQIASRLLLVWGIMQALPESPANYSWVYITLCLSWSITEIIRYSYYAANLADPNNIPSWLVWLRYSTFFVLYPTGVSSEMCMIYLSLDDAAQTYGSWAKYALIAILFSYGPGFYTLYTYMINQRKKVLGKQATTKKTQ